MVDFYSFIRGTTSTIFSVGASAVKKITGGVAIRDADDTTDEALTASQIKISGNSFELNSDAAATGGDYKITIARPTSGMTANYTYTLPINPGSPGQATLTDGAGNHYYGDVGNTAPCVKVDRTALAFGTSTPVTMFTTPASGVINKMRFKVDTAWNGTNPSISVGIAGDTSKYLGAGDVNLQKVGIHEVNLEADSSSEALIITYSAGGATQGAGGLFTYYEVPS